MSHERSNHAPAAFRIVDGRVEADQSPETLAHLTQDCRYLQQRAARLAVALGASETVGMVVADQWGTFAMGRDSGSPHGAVMTGLLAPGSLAPEAVDRLVNRWIQ